MTSVTRYTVRDGRIAEKVDGGWVHWDDFKVVHDSHHWLCREKERLESALKQIIALTTGPDRGSAAWQIEAAVEIATNALPSQSTRPREHE